MMSAPTTPHREAYEALVKGGVAKVIRNFIAGARVGEGRLDVGEVTVVPPSITEHDARLTCRNWRGWIQAELRFVPGAGRPPQQIEPSLNLPLPWMTNHGTFIRQGIELVPIVQLLPRPGAWLRSSLNESGTRRTAQLDIIPSLGSRLRLLQARDVDRIAGASVTDPVRLVWLTSWRQDPPKDLTSLKGLMASTAGAAWVPTLGAEGRDRLNAFVRRALGTYDGTSEYLTVADLDALETCLERALDEPDPSGPGFGPDPADLREMRALTIADQVSDALAAALAVARDRAQSRLVELQSSQAPSIDEARTLVAELIAFGQAALSQEPARGGIVMEWR